jgi:hypothetical protein
MHFIPRIKYEYNTLLNQEIILKRIIDYLVASKSLGYFKYSFESIDEVYIGKVEGNNFYFKPKFRGWINNKIKGVVTSDGNKSKIQITIRLHLFYFLFLVIFESLMILIILFAENPFPMIIFGIIIYLISLFSLKYTYWRVDDVIQKILKQ